MLGQRLPLVGLFFVLTKGEASNRYPKRTQNALRGGKPEFFNANGYCGLYSQLPAES